MKLNECFSIERYGLKVNLITEDDAEFIVQLRSDPSRTQYMVALEGDVEKQRRWVKEYKTREHEGTDYYLVYRNFNNERRGVHRICQVNFRSKSCKGASWIKRAGPAEEAIAMFILHKEIIFDVLGMQSFRSDIHKDNRKMLKYYEGLENCLVKEKNGFLYFEINKNNWRRVSQRFYDEIERTE